MNRFPPPPARRLTFPDDFHCRRCGGPLENPPLVSYLLCANCYREQRDKEKNEAEQKARVRQRIVCLRRLESLPPAFHETKVDRLPQELLRRVLNWKYNHRGILLYGPTGSTKTRCMFELLKKLIGENRNPQFFLAGEFESRCHSKFLDGTGPGWLEQVQESDVVFFDDLLKGKMTERAQSSLFQIIEHRLSYKLPTLATANEHPLRFRQRLGGEHADPLIRRLLEATDVIEVDANALKLTAPFSEQH